MGDDHRDPSFKNAFEKLPPTLAGWPLVDQHADLIGIIGPDQILELLTEQPVAADPFERGVIDGQRVFLDNIERDWVDLGDCGHPLSVRGAEGIDLA